MVAGIAIALTLFIGLVALNLRTGEKRIEEKVERLYGAADPQFSRVMSALLGPPILDGNLFQVLRNGDEIFPSMLEAIRGARSTISFESYIYWSGTIGKEFADALSERARAGVKVHLLLDWLGSSKLDASQLAQMESAGVEVRRFHEPKFYHLARLNNRTHRKLLIVDGNVGFTGGVGIADEWAGHAQDPSHWRDTHFRAEGPVVAQMQAVFMDNWVKVTGKVLHGTGYFPAIPAAGESRGQMFSSSPEGGSESMRLMYLLAITAAAHSIDLSSAYFVPDPLTMRTLVDAAKRGVAIRIITPGEHMDAETVRRASRAGWGDLLRAGVKIYEYQPTMFHCKVLVVDNLWTSVGSTNFDSRSFGLNDEANLNIVDGDFARRQVEVFEQDLRQSGAITLAQWQARPMSEKLLEHAAALLGGQL
ncbi:MAG: phospholipase D-like domain-containing protein [Betaproteobacteria bacterium]